MGKHKISIAILNRDGLQRGLCCGIRSLWRDWKMLIGTTQLYNMGLPELKEMFLHVKCLLFFLLFFWAYFFVVLGGGALETGKGPYMKKYLQAPSPHVVCLGARFTFIFFWFLFFILFFFLGIIILITVGILCH